MPEYIEREKLYNNLILLAKYETGDRQQGILGCAEAVRILSAADVAPVVHGRWIEQEDPMLDRDMPPHSFCNLGVRKDEERNER